MGRSVSYATGAQVVTFNTIDYSCSECDGGEAEDAKNCDICKGTGYEEDPEGWRYEQLIEDFQQHLAYLFPSVTSCDEWLGNEDHVLAENRLAQFGMSEYCGLVSYWIVPKESGYYSDDQIEPLAKRWIAQIEDKFVAAFGELTKVGSMSNGEGVYRRISNS